MSEVTTPVPPRKDPGNTLIRFTFICFVATVLFAVVILAVVLSDNGAGSGSFLGLGLFILFLYTLLPMHGVGLVWSIVGVCRAVTRRVSGWPLLYFAAWGVLAVTLLIRSGLADPLFESWEQRRYASEHPAEVELMELIQRSADWQRPDPTARIAELIAAGADVNHKDRQFGLTPLQWTAMRGSAAMLEPLLDGGADLSATAPRPWSVARFMLHGVNALELAAWADREREAKVKRLLAAGAEPTAQALIGLCHGGYLELVQQLAEQVDIANDRLSSGESCLDVATKADHSSLVNWLLERSVAADRAGG